MTKPTLGGGLRGGDMAPPKLVLENEFPPNVDRDLLQTATVRLINNCGVDAYIGVKYTGASGSYVYTWPFIGAGGAVVLRQVADSTIYIYGVAAEDTSQTVWQAANNNGHCFSSGDCLDERDIGDLSNGFVKYKICGDSSSFLQGADGEWLNGHNSRRADFHAFYGKSRADMKWSNSLKQSAQAYANKLLRLGGGNRCVIRHGYLGDNYGGENLAANWGTDPNTLAATPEQVMTGWFEEEIVLPYGENLHATQMVFRSSRYLGCAVAEKDLNNGGKCYIHVCRYIAPGNCNMTPNGWLARTLDDTVICGPACPPEGC